MQVMGISFNLKESLETYLTYQYAENLVAEHSYVNYGKSTFQLVDILGNDELSRPLFGRFVRASEARKLDQRGVHTRVLMATILPVVHQVAASFSSHSSVIVILKSQLG